MLSTMSTQQMEETTTAPVLTKAQTEERRRLNEWLDERILASKKEPSAEVVNLVPGLAQLLLEHNSVNRPLAVQNCRDLGSDIAGGRFEFNGESIVVSRTGVLLDGQHRCQQVVATGKPIKTVIVFGPKDEARFTIDIGKPKSVSNFLVMKGKHYSHVLAAVANFSLQWRNNGYISHGSAASRPTKAEILAAAEETRGLDTSIEFTAPCMKTVRAHAVLAFCHHVFWKKAGREAADHFILRLIEGDGLKKGDPILYCRNRLLGMGREAFANARVELVFKCWNAHRRGHGIDHLKLGAASLPKVEV